jgi:hypothetical protein
MGLCQPVWLTLGEINRAHVCGRRRGCAVSLCRVQSEALGSCGGTGWCQPDGAPDAWVKMRIVIGFRIGAIVVMSIDRGQAAVAG